MKICIKQESSNQSLQWNEIEATKYKELVEHIKKDKKMKALKEEDNIILFSNCGEGSPDDPAEKDIQDLIRYNFR